jgi:hypothetical protein
LGLSVEILAATRAIRLGDSSRFARVSHVVHSSFVLSIQTMQELILVFLTIGLLRHIMPQPITPFATISRALVITTHLWRSLRKWRWVYDSLPNHSRDPSIYLIILDLEGT